MRRSANILSAVLIFGLIAGAMVDRAHASTDPEAPSRTRLSREELQALRLALSDAKDRGFNVDEASATVYSDGEDIIVSLFIRVRIDGDQIILPPFGSGGNLTYTIRHGAITETDFDK